MTVLKIIQVKADEQKRHVKELFAKEAHALYRSLGFHKREPYAEVNCSH